MAKVTITVEGEAEEIRRTLESLLGALNEEQNGHVEEQDALHETTVDTRWTPEEVAALWGELAPQARPIVAEIAKKPEGIYFDAVRKSLGLEGLTVAGRLSSLGFALKRLKLNKPEPIVRDWRAKQYRMAPEVAEVIRQLAENEAEHS